jgi:hypothetical protein
LQAAAVAVAAQTGQDQAVAVYSVKVMRAQREVVALMRALAAALAQRLQAGTAATDLRVQLLERQSRAAVAVLLILAVRAAQVAAAVQRLQVTERQTQVAAAVVLVLAVRA